MSLKLECDQKELKNALDLNLTGPYKVGTIVHQVIDKDRHDPFFASEPRELKVRFWYPAIHDEAYPLESYYDEAIAAVQTFNHFMGVERESVSDLRSIKIPVQKKAQPVRQKFPVIFLLHGYLASAPEMYSLFAHELVSHGYIVVGISHTHFANKVVISGNRTVTFNKDKQSSFLSDYYKYEDQELWISDVDSVVSEIEKMQDDSESFLHGLFDMDRVGVMGHSFGGVVALMLAAKKNLFRACVSLDGVALGDVIPSKSSKIYFAQTSVETFYLPSSDEELSAQLNCPLAFIADARREALIAIRTLNSEVISGLGHNGFTDLLLLKDSPIYFKNQATAAMIGAVNGKIALQAINQGITDFFKANLK